MLIFRAMAVTICEIGVAKGSLGMGYLRFQDEQEGFPVAEGGQFSGDVPEVLSFQRQCHCCDCAFLFFDSLRRLRYQLGVFDWETGSERVHEFATLKKFEGRMLDLLGGFFTATRIVDRHRDEVDWPAFWEVVDEVRSAIEDLRKETRHTLRPRRTEVRVRPWWSRVAHIIFCSLRFWRVCEHESRACKESLKAVGGIASAAGKQLGPHEAVLEDLHTEAQRQLESARQELEAILFRSGPG